MSTQDFTLKRYSGSEWVTLYPETIPSQVTGLLNGEGKLNTSFLPDSMLGSMKYIGAITDAVQGTNENILKTFITGDVTLDSEAANLDMYTSPNTSRLARGNYVVVSGTDVTITNTVFTHVVASTTYYYKFVTAANFFDEDGLGALENGDWIIFDCITQASTASDYGTSSSNPFQVSVGIINNTYQNASGTAFGIVKLANTNSLTTSMTGVVPTAAQVVSYIGSKNYSTTTGTVTSITLTQGDGITISNSGTAITGSGTRTISLTETSVTAGSDYTKVSVDKYGRVTAASNPTTLDGYGITDAKIANGVITLGSNTITPITDISSKANLSGATFTGAVTIPTLTVSTAMNMSTNAFGTTAGHLKYAADGKISIDTATYATTTQLAAKADTASPTFTGTVTLPNLEVNGDITLATKEYGTSAGHLAYNTSGGVTVDTTSYLSTSGTAAAASKLSNTSAIGSATTPVYFTSGGVPSAVTSIAVGLIAAASDSANGLLTSTQNKLLTGLATMSSTAPSSPTTGEIYFAI